MRRRRGRLTLTRSVIPRKRVVTLNYSEQISIVSAATLQHYNYRCNSIFDPNSTGGGHQPLGHDQLADLYQHYTVIGSKIYLRALNKNTGDGSVVGVGIIPSTSHSTSLAEWVEQPQRKTRMLGEFTSGNNVGYLKMGWSAKKQLGVTNPVGDDTLRAAFGSNPTEQSYFDIIAAETTYGAYGGTVVFDVFIKYIVVCTEPKTLALS